MEPLPEPIWILGIGLVRNRLGIAARTLAIGNVGIERALRDVVINGEDRHQRAARASEAAQAALVAATRNRMAAETAAREATDASTAATTAQTAAATAAHDAWRRTALARQRELETLLIAARGMGRQTTVSAGHAMSQ